MVFVALYVNTKNELCTVLKDSIYIIYGKQKEQMHSFLDAMKFVADDFSRFVEVNKTQIRLNQNEIECIDDYCNCSHAFLEDLKRFVNINYEKGEKYASN